MPYAAVRPRTSARRATSRGASRRALRIDSRLAGANESRSIHASTAALPTVSASRQRAIGRVGIEPAESARGERRGGQAFRFWPRRRLGAEEAPRAEPAGRSQRCQGPRLRQQQLELGAQAVSGQSAVDVEPGGVGGQPLARAVDPASQPRGEAGRAEDARGVLHERQRVEHADSAGAEIGEPARRVQEPAPLRAVEPDREGVQREVPASEVLRERGPLHGGERPGRPVGLAPRGREVDPAAVRQDDGRREKDGVLHGPSAQISATPWATARAPPLDDEIEIRSRVDAAEQHVPDETAHGGHREPERLPVGSRDPEDLRCSS